MLWHLANKEVPSRPFFCVAAWFYMPPLPDALEDAE